MQVGYKELCIHMASHHGGLEEVMAKGEMEAVSYTHLTLPTILLV